MNETLQNMFRNVTDQVSQLVGGYLPNLLGALGILVIGWLVAVVVAAVVRGALKRTTIDNRIAAWMGASQDVEVERYAGKSAYWLIMLFVLVAFFQALNLTNVDRAAQCAAEPAHRVRAATPRCRHVAPGGVAGRHRRQEADHRRHVRGQGRRTAQR